MNCELELESGIEIEEERYFEENIDDLILQLEKMDNFVKQSISNYFLNQEMYTGELIKKSLIHLPYYVSLVRDTSVSEGVLKAYKIIEDCGYCDSVSLNKTGIAEDIKFVLNIIKDIEKKVSQEFVGGILLMHLELFEGLEIW